MTADRVLDYIPRLDTRNRAYRLTAADPALLQQARWWTGGVVLDQEPTRWDDPHYDGGGCVGHGTVGEYLASPVRGKVDQSNDNGTVRVGMALTRAEAAHRLAVAVYESAKELDEWEGVNYEGTSVRAGMLVARNRAWITGFQWAFNLAELRTALETGPVVIGVEWREESYETAPNGDLLVGGPVAGGHCLLVTGYSPNYAGRGPRYRLRNSWSQQWGRGGNGYIAPDDLDSILFRAGGEAAIPVGRHL